MLCIPEKSRLEGRYLAVQLHRPGQGGCSCQQDQVLAFLHQRLRCFGPGLLWVIVISKALYHKEGSSQAQISFNPTSCCVPKSVFEG